MRRFSRCVYIYLNTTSTNSKLSHFSLFQGVTYALLTKFICVYVYWTTTPRHTGYLFGVCLFLGNNSMSQKQHTTITRETLNILATLPALTNTAGNTATTFKHCPPSFESDAKVLHYKAAALLMLSCWESVLCHVWAAYKNEHAV